MHQQERRTEPGWTVEPGTYDVVIGNSVTDIVSSTPIELIAKD